jgi:lipid-binding SYLF domain-containing protein
VAALCETAHLSLGGSLGAALGPLGRSADAALVVRGRMVHDGFC